MTIYRHHTPIVANVGGNGHIFLPLKGCRGIVYTHGVRMGGRVGGGREKVCPGYISETVS